MKRHFPPEISAHQNLLRTMVDRIIEEQTVYAPVELLLADGRLGYSDYESWRCGKTELLEPLLRDKPDSVWRDLMHTASYVKSLDFVADTYRYTIWDGSDTPPRFSKDPSHDLLFCTHYVPRSDTRQPDLFLNNAGLALTNELIRALRERQNDKAGALLDKLFKYHPHNSRLSDFKQLVMAQRGVNAPVSNASKEFKALQKTIRPLAVALLGADARDYLTPLWRRLGPGLEKWHPADPELHRSFVCAKAHDWAGVKAAVEAEPNEHPILLIRLSSAFHFLGDPYAEFTTWFRLFWRFPEQAQQAISASPSLDQRTLWRAFEDIEEELDAVFFPAWVLLNIPELIHRLPEHHVGNTNAEKSYLIVRQLLSLNRQSGHNTLENKEIQLRADLRQASEGLFGWYLKHWLRVSPKKFSAMAGR